MIPLEHKRKPGKLRQVYSKLKGKNKDKQYIPLCELFFIVDIVKLLITDEFGHKFLKVKTLYLLVN